MSQFWIHENANPSAKAGYPYLLDIQSPLLENLESRLVLPLAPLARFEGKPIRNLTPTVSIGGTDYIILLPQAAGVNRKNLGEAVMDLSQRRGELVSAMDFLITGF